MPIADVRERRADLHHPACALPHQLRCAATAALAAEHDAGMEVRRRQGEGMGPPIVYALMVVAVVALLENLRHLAAEMLGSCDDRGEACLFWISDTWTRLFQATVVVASSVAVVLRRRAWLRVSAIAGWICVLIQLVGIVGSGWSAPG